jgi:hypothetical protein
MIHYPLTAPMPWDLGKTFRRLFVWPNKAIDNENAFGSASQNSQKKTILDDLQFIPHAAASDWAAHLPDGDWCFHRAIASPPGGDVGYFHNASLRLTMITSIVALDFTDKLEIFKKMPNYDEYTEVIVFDPEGRGISPANDGNSSPNWQFYFVDHFNRRFLMQPEFEVDPNQSIEKVIPGTSEQLYRQWMKLATSENSHYYKPSKDEKQSLGRKIAQQIVWDYQTGSSLLPVNALDNLLMGYTLISACCQRY